MQTLDPKKRIRETSSKNIKLFSLFLCILCLILFMVALQDPKFKVHKPVKASLRLEIERLPNEDHEHDMVSDFGSFGHGSIDGDSRSIVGPSFSGRFMAGQGMTKALPNGRQKWSPGEKHRSMHSGSLGSIEFGRSDVCLPGMPKFSISFPFFYSYALKFE